MAANLVAATICTYNSLRFFLRPDSRRSTVRNFITLVANLHPSFPRIHAPHCTAVLVIASLAPRPTRTWFDIRWLSHLDTPAHRRQHLTLRAPPHFLRLPFASLRGLSPADTVPRSKGRADTFWHPAIEFVDLWLRHLQSSTLCLQPFQIQRRLSELTARDTPTPGTRSAEAVLLPSLTLGSPPSS